MERNIKNMKISNKYDRLVRKLIAGESSSEEMEELAHWNVVETKMKKQFDAAKNIVENGALVAGVGAEGTAVGDDHAAGECFMAKEERKTGEG